MGFQPTLEQYEGIAKAKTGSDLKIEGLAGTAKTSLLSLIANNTDKKRPIFISHNKLIAKEARKWFPSNVQCITAHSFAFKRVGHRYSNRIGNLNPQYVSKVLRTQKDSTYNLSSETVSSLVIHMLNRYMQSADFEIQPMHFPAYMIRHINEKRQKINSPDPLIDPNQIGPIVMRHTIDLWNKIVAPTGTVTVPHDAYLKLWQLVGPDMKKDLILFDEVQDANPVMLDIIAKQDAQKIYAGDRWQQIYAWRGATNSMDQVITPESLKLSQSFRFDDTVADKATSVLRNLAGAKIKLKGSESISKADNSEAIICRNSITTIDSLFESYMNGRKPMLIGNASEQRRIINDIRKLEYGGVAPGHRDLLGINNWNQLQDYANTAHGKPIRSLLNLIKQYGYDELETVLSESERNTPENSNLIISTAHKTKGCEFGSVTLSDDFIPTPKVKEEANLLYVALTRAKHTLKGDNCAALQLAINPPKHALKEQRREHKIA